MAKVIAFYLCPGHQILDLAGPLAVLEAANRLGKGDHYQFRLFSSQGGMVPGSLLSLATDLFSDAPTHTLMIVGGETEPMRNVKEVEAVGTLARSAVRVASICSGAFLLAETGLLDGREATTHWALASDLQHRHPRIAVDAERIFIKSGPIWTSAGMSAGIDLTLALVEVDHGQALARAVARELVVYHRRPGGQSQFAEISALEPRTDRIRRALTYANDHLAEALSTETLAEVANLSPRQFTRVFRKETGESPAKAVERLRAEAARCRLVESAAPVEEIARAVGFADPERMRRTFQRLYGHSPQVMRRLGRAAAPPSAGDFRWPE